jgi:tetratricopeptide (TPR) repeat protein
VVQADQGEGRHRERGAWRRWIGATLAGFAAALSVFATIAASLYLPHGSPPSAAQYAWATLASAITGALTFLQVRRTAADSTANHRMQLQQDETMPQSWLPAALAQLPPDIHDFTGRDQPVRQARTLLARTPDRPAGVRTVVVSAIAGKPGVGKTALAIHLAHQLRPQFPDGQLYVNLRGPEAEPLDPGRVLREFLHAMGVAEATIPEGLEERARLYRARLADRRVLVVLDNAATEAQLRPLLPGGASCAVLITSRTRLTGLEAAHLIDLDVLGPESAVELLAKVAGPERVTAEPQAAQRIVAYCGHLPLAIRIAGARLAARPQWRLARLAERLAAQHRRLDELATGDREVRASFALSYQEQANDEQRAFCRLGLLVGADFAAWVAAPLLGVALAQAERAVEHLADAQLLEVAGEDATGQLRYRFHDLLRLFAHERLAAEEPLTAQRAAQKRLVGAYLAIAKLANAALPYPHTLRLADQRADVNPASSNEAPRRSPLDHDPDLHALATRLVQDPLAWLSVERANLVAAVEQAYRARWWTLTYQLAATLAQFCDDHRHWDDWQHTHELAVDAARQAQDPPAEATTLHNLAMVYREQGRWDDARTCLERALAIFRTANNRPGEAATLLRLGVVYRYHGQWATATSYLTQALPILQEVGDRHREGNILRDLGIIDRQQGRLFDAVAHYQRSLDIFREVGDRRGQLHTLQALGDALTDQRSFNDAVQCLKQAIELAHEENDFLWEAYTFGSLGRAYGLQHHLNDALRCFDRSLSVLQAHGFRRREAIVRRSLGEVYLTHRRLGDARACFEQALPVFRSTSDRPGEAQTLRGLGLTLIALGDKAGAETTLRDAVTLLDALDAPQAEEIRAQLVKLSSLDRST